MRIPLLIVVASLLLTACGGGSADGPSVAGDGDGAAADVDGDWVLVDGIEVPDGARVTLTVDGDSVGGTAACNGYGGTVDRAGGGFVVSQLGQTEMGCEPDVMAAEAAWLEALGIVTDATREDDRLVLTGPDVRLVLDRLAPVETAALVDTTWTLEGVVRGAGDEGVVASPVGDLATLVLHADGTVAASTGCRDFVGEWTANGDEIVLTTFGTTTDGACPGDLATQDDHVVTVLGDGFRAEVDGDRLTLTDGELGLVYRSGDAGDALSPATSTTDVVAVVRVTRWVVTEGSIDGRIVAADGESATIEFGDGTIGGNDTCNSFGGELTLDARGRATISQVNRTMRACEGNAWDGLTAALGQVTSIVPVEDGMLSLTGDGVELLLAPADTQG